MVGLYVCAMYSIRIEFEVCKVVVGTSGKLLLQVGNTHNKNGELLVQLRNKAYYFSNDLYLFFFCAGDRTSYEVLAP